VTAEGKNDEANDYQNHIQHEDMTPPHPREESIALIANKVLAKHSLTEATELTTYK
jgi:hypothetical protein